MLTPEEIQKRFGIPNLVSGLGVQAKAEETVFGIVKATAQEVDAICPDGRELALVFTHLEEALFWALAAIQRNPEGL